MNLQQIKDAIAKGQTVHWSNTGYTVEQSKSGIYHIVFAGNGHRIGLTWLDGVTLNGKEEDFYVGSKPFTVIGFYESNGQIFSHHVQANCAMGAFAVVASMDVDAMPLVALDGHQQEGKGVEFVGEGLVDAQTILEQPDVFGG